VNIDNRGIDQNGEQIEGSMDLTEVCATQIGDGRIMALIRPIYSPWMWETWSDDGGMTWGPCIRGAFPGYATPNMLRTSSGAILVAHRMPSLTIHCSLDDGMTFDQGTMIDSGLWCMGSMIEVEPDLVLYAYMDSFESLMRAQFIRITATGLEPVE
ncbi:exo-alpha-sialidase, partial [bacterium]|nr:exo-alpha-sialidase [bacterium]